MIEAWGLLNAVDSKGRRIPYPALVTLDLEGRVADVFVETNYRLRPPAAEVVEKLESLFDGAPIPSEP